MMITNARAAMTRTALAAATLAASALLAACAGTSTPTAYFTLQPVPPASAAPSPYAGPPVQVLAVRLPATLDRVELLRETAPGRFEVDDFARWAGPPARIARQTLTENLVNRLRARWCSRKPSGPKARWACRWTSSRCAAAGAACRRT